MSPSRCWKPIISTCWSTLNRNLSSTAIDTGSMNFGTIAILQSRGTFWSNILIHCDISTFHFHHLINLLLFNKMWYFFCATLCSREKRANSVTCLLQQADKTMRFPFIALNRRTRCHRNNYNYFFKRRIVIFWNMVKPFTGAWWIANIVYFDTAGCS